MHAAYRIGIDVGSNSIGWVLLDLDDTGRPCGVRDLGVQVFPDGRDPQSGTSLAVDRRVARSMRRRRDRYLLRREDLMAALVRHGLMPSDEAERKELEPLDPYEMRARGLDEALSPHELGRALFHLHQRRGFKSNRKTERGDNEAGKIKQGVESLRRIMAESQARTLGEYFYHRHRERLSVRARLQGEGAKAAYDFYPERALVEEEFERLWRTQAEFNPALAETARAEIHRIMFRQRPLRPVDPGKCALDPTDPRAPRALPLSQLFRIYQELANVRIVTGRYRERPLSLAERDILAGKLRSTDKLTFERAERLLKLEEAVTFNLANEKRAHLKGDETAKVLAHKARFGKAWRDLPLERQGEIVERLLDAEDEAALVAWLREDCGLEEPAARKTAEAPLPPGYGRLGREALSKIVPILMNEPGEEFADPDSGKVQTAPIGYAAAAETAGYHHSDRQPDRLRDKLPYYGEVLQRHVAGSGLHHDRPEVRYGRIANPTVHIGLNRMRRLINALIAKHGAPEEIIVELARELKLSQQDKDRIRREQAENQKMNDARRARLEELGLPDNGQNRMRLRLWEELNPSAAHDRRCVYSGERISIERLFGPEVEVDHILPFSRTLDDGAANRIVSLRRANRDKGNRSPWEAFAENSDAWEKILARADSLPDNKRWRFSPEAMERFEGEHDFLDRQITDTAYLARVTKEYLCHVCPANKVWVTPGRLTAMLRGKWGLNALLPDHNLPPPAGDPKKNRRDHRHHAVDAFVTALTERGLLNRVARAADETRERLIEKMPEPWEGFRDHLRAALERLLVYHRPDHGREGKLHEETAYGLVGDPDAEDGHNLVYRKPFAGLNENEIARIRDRHLRREVEGHLYQAKQEVVPLKQALAAFNESRKTRGLAQIRHVRLLKKEAEVIPIHDRDGRVYKAYSPGDNHRIEIYELPDGRWRGEAVTVYQANRPDHMPLWRKQEPDARLVMRVHKGDLLKLNGAGGEQIMCVVRLNARADRLYLAPHNETGDLQKRHDDVDDPFRWLLASFNRMRELNARRVTVDLMGRLHDSGAPFSR